MKKATNNLEDQIRRAIKKGKWTAYRLSKDTGIHHTVISRFINGERSLTLTTASKLVEALGLELVEKKKGR